MENKARRSKRKRSHKGCGKYLNPDLLENSDESGGEESELGDAAGSLAAQELEQGDDEFEQESGGELDENDENGEGAGDHQGAPAGDAEDDNGAIVLEDEITIEVLNKKTAWKDAICDKVRNVKVTPDDPLTVERLAKLVRTLQGLKHAKIEDMCLLSLNKSQFSPAAFNQGNLDELLATLESKQLRVALRVGVELGKTDRINAKQALAEQKEQKALAKLAESERKSSVGKKTKVSRAQNEEFRKELAKLFDRYGVPPDCDYDMPSLSKWAEALLRSEANVTLDTPPAGVSKKASKQERRVGHANAAAAARVGAQGEAAAGGSGDVKAKPAAPPAPAPPSSASSSSSSTKVLWRVQGFGGVPNAAIALPLDGSVGDLFARTVQHHGQRGGVPATAFQGLGLSNGASMPDDTPLNTLWDPLRNQQRETLILQPALISGAVTVKEGGHADRAEPLSIPRHVAETMTIQALADQLVSRFLSAGRRCVSITLLDGTPIDGILAERLRDLAHNQQLPALLMTIAPVS